MTVLDGYTQRHVTEREIAHATPCGWDGPAWEDCTWTSAIEWLRASGHPGLPATLTEAEALRCKAGEPPSGGSNQDDVRRGIAARYGLTVAPVVKGGPAILAALTPGHVATVQGSMGAFPASHRLRRWDPGFSGPHDVVAFRADATSSVWWCDPLAPEGLGYQGEPVSLADLVDYIDALPGAGALVAKIVPDVVPVVHHYNIAPGVRTLYIASTTADTPPRIQAWRTVPWSGLPSQAVCGPATYLRGTVRGGATVARITAGASTILGTWLRVGDQWGTSVTP